MKFRDLEKSLKNQALNKISENDYETRKKKVEKINLLSEENILKTQTRNENETEGVRLDIDDIISNSSESIIKVEDDNSEFRKQQTFKRMYSSILIPSDNSNLIQFKKLESEHGPFLVNHHSTPLDEEFKDTDVGKYQPLPSLGSNVYGLDVKKISLKINPTALAGSLALTAIGYAISFIFGSFISGIMSFMVYLFFDFELFNDGITAIDTTSPASRYKVVENISAPSDIIFNELINSNEIEQYNIMQSVPPHTIHEDAINNITTK